jgi:hypothetical protein
MSLNAGLQCALASSQGLDRRVWRPYHRLSATKNSAFEGSIHCQLTNVFVLGPAARFIPNAVFTT